MGLFSKTKVFVDSFNMSLYEEVNDVVKQTVVNAVLQDRNIADDLRTNIVSGLGTKAKQYYRYGRDTYTYGLPDGAMQRKYAGAGAVKIVLDSFEPDNPCTITFNIFDTANAELFAHEHLVNNRGWNPDTNIVSNPNFNNNGNQVTLYSAEWLSTTQILLKYLFIDEDSLEEETITIDAVDNEAKYYHVGFIRSNTPNVTEYWFYDPNDGDYESLLTDDIGYGKAYFPIVPLIRDNVDMTNKTTKGNTDLWRTSRSLLKKLDIDFEQLGESLQQNPDIDGVDHAFLTIGMPLQSDSEKGLDYLYRFWFRQAQRSTHNQADFDAWFNRDSKSLPPWNIINITEAEDKPTDGRYQTQIGYKYIEVNTHTGSIGDVGTVTKQNAIAGSTKRHGYDIENSIIIFTKQITDNTFSEVRVHGPKHISYIYKKHTVDTTLADSTDTGDADTAGKNNFIVPIDIDLLDEFSATDKTDFMREAIRITMHSVEKVKLKWYQTSIFKAIVAIIVAVITYYSGGTTSGILGNVIAAVGVTNVVLQILITIIYNAIVGALISKLVDEIGLKRFAILQFMYVAYSVYNADFSALTSADYLSIINGLTTAAQSYMKGEMQEEITYAQELAKDMAREQEELDKMLEAFPRSYIDPMAIADIYSLNIPGESPSDYYNNRIHIGNVGVLALSEAYYYVDNNLRLPGITDREGLNFS